MEKLVYKDVTWPLNPHTYRETVTREPQYVTQDGVSTYTGMSHMRRSITGSGVFCGSSAYEDFKQLIEAAESSTPGNLIHPVWGVRYCYLTKLELLQEPRENYVEYSFEFTQANAKGEVPR